MTTTGNVLRQDIEKQQTWTQSNLEHVQQMFQVFEHADARPQPERNQSHPTGIVSQLLDATDFVRNHRLAYCLF